MSEQKTRAWAHPLKKDGGNMNNSEFQQAVIASLTKLETLLNGAIEKADDHEKRIRAMEFWKYGLAGSWVVICWIIYKLSITVSIN